MLVVVVVVVVVVRGLILRMVFGGILIVSVGFIVV